MMVNPLSTAAVGDLNGPNSNQPLANSDLCNVYLQALQAYKVSLNRHLHLSDFFRSREDFSAKSCLKIFAALSLELSCCNDYKPSFIELEVGPGHIKLRLGSSELFNEDYVAILKIISLRLELLISTDAYSVRAQK